MHRVFFNRPVSLLREVSTYLDSPVNTGLPCHTGSQAQSLYPKDEDKRGRPGLPLRLLIGRLLLKKVWCHSQPRPCLPHHALHPPDGGGASASQSPPLSHLSEQTGQKAGQGSL